MKALWAVCEAFTEEECEWIIQTIKKEKPTWAETGRPGGDLNKIFEHRRSKVFWITPNHPQLFYIHKRYWEIVTSINNDFYKAHITDLPPIQFTQYSDQYQGEYKMHMDLNWLETHVHAANPNHQRKISAIVQLSNPNSYEGGTFEFGPEVPEKPSQEIVRKRGMMTVFPSFLHHAVHPVTKGIRYSLVGWFEGPPWR